MEVLYNKSLTVWQTQLLFFTLVLLHVSVVFYHHQCINAVLQLKVKNA